MTSEAWIALGALVVSMIGALWQWSSSFEKKIVQLFAKNDDVVSDLNDSKKSIDDQRKEIDATNLKVSQIEINHVRIQKDIDTLFYQFKEQKLLLQNIANDLVSIKTDLGVIKSKLNRME